jgi:hypothetical protein
MALPSDHALVRDLVRAGVAAIDADVKAAGANKRFEAAVWAVAEEEGRDEELMDVTGEAWKDYVKELLKRGYFDGSGINQNYVAALLRPSNAGKKGMGEETRLRDLGRNWLNNVWTICKRERLGLVSPPPKPKTTKTSVTKAPMVDKSAQVTRRGSLAAGGGGGGEEDEAEEDEAEEDEEDEEDKDVYPPSAAVGGGGSAAAAVAVAPVAPKPVAPVETVEDSVELGFTVSKAEFLEFYKTAGGSHAPLIAWRLFKQQNVNFEPAVKALVEDMVEVSCPEVMTLAECFRCGTASRHDGVGWLDVELLPCDTCHPLPKPAVPELAGQVPKVLFCDGCLEHTCATAENLLLPLDPKNLERALEVRENLDAVIEHVAMVAPVALVAPVAVEEEYDFELLDDEDSAPVAEAVAPLAVPAPVEPAPVAVPAPVAAPAPEAAKDDAEDEEPEDSIIPFTRKGVKYLRYGHLDEEGVGVWHEDGDLWLPVSPSSPEEHKARGRGAYVGQLNVAEFPKPPYSTRVHGRRRPSPPRPRGQRSR